MFFQGPLFIIGFGLAVVLFIASLSAFLRRTLDVRGFVFWLVMSLALSIVALFPGITEGLASIIGLQVRGLFVLTVALLVVYVLVYSMYVRQQRLDKRLRLISQELSLLRYRHEYGLEVSNASSRDDSSPE